MPKDSSIDYDKMLTASRQGLNVCSHAASDVTPRYLACDVIAPVRTIGVGANSSLKATFWHSTVETCDNDGDPDFVCIALNTGGGPIWRNNETIPSQVGSVAMQPFEGARWRFEHPVSFVQLYVPFTFSKPSRRTSSTGSLRTTSCGCRQALEATDYAMPCGRFDMPSR